MRNLPIGIMLLTTALCAVAQSQQIPTINPNGIIRADTNMPGILPPGVVISIWGQNFGPAIGCKGPAMELCGVQVLLDGKPIEVQFTHDILINARIPDDPVTQPVSQLVVVSGGRRSAPAEVRRLPEMAKIRLEGVARVDGPIWIHVEPMQHLRIGYPPLWIPWNFACDEFEVRQGGKTIAPMTPPQVGMGGSLGPCPSFSDPSMSAGQASRLPLHLQYSLAEPGTYEVRLTHYGDFSRRKGDLRGQSAWLSFEVLPAVPRVISTHPHEPGEIISSFLPDLLALRNDETLTVLLEYAYHSSRPVRAYAANALNYWPADILEPRLLETIRTNGPSAFLVDLLKMHVAELVELALPDIGSDDAVLFNGALAAMRRALSPDSPVTAELRSKVEERLISVSNNLGHTDPQAVNEVISALGQVRGHDVRDQLWSLVNSHTGTEQALIAVAWQKDSRDLPRLTEYLIAAPLEGPQGYPQFTSMPNVLVHNFGDAALPALRTILDKAASYRLKVGCADELIRAHDPAGLAFALDAVENTRPWTKDMISRLTDIFPETRNNTVAQLTVFLNKQKP